LRSTLEKAADEALHWHREPPLSRAKGLETPKWTEIVRFYSGRLGVAFPDEVGRVRQLRHLLTHQRGEFRSQQQRDQYGDLDGIFGGLRVELTEEMTTQALDTLGAAVRLVDRDAYRVSWGREELPPTSGAGEGAERRRENQQRPGWEPLHTSGGLLVESAHEEDGTLHRVLRD
jgi:hypothetical protein